MRSLPFADFEKVSEKTRQSTPENNYFRKSADLNQAFTLQNTHTVTNLNLPTHPPLPPLQQRKVTPMTAEPIITEIQYAAKLTVSFVARRWRTT